MKRESISTPVRLGTDSVKWGLFDEDVLPLWVADTDFQSPAAVIEALRERVEHGVFGYPLHPPEFRDLVAARMLERYNWKISPKDMIFIPGVVPGFNLTCQLLTKPGESILVQPPVYPPIYNAAEKANVRNIRAELIRQPDGSYAVDFDALEAAIEDDTRCLIFCNPHNPVGKVYSREELQRLADICLRHKLTIISDEIHSDLVFEGNKHIPIASLSDEISQSTVTLIAPSKTFNIAGLSCAVLICTNHELLKKIEAAAHGLLGDVNVLGLTAAIAAYREGGEWLEQMMGILEGNRDFVVDIVQKRLPQIKMYSPDATYLAWLDCNELDLPEDPFKFFLKKAKVALNCGDDFGDGGKGFVRLNFGCSRELLTEALERMEKAIRER